MLKVRIIRKFESGGLRRKGSGVIQDTFPASLRKDRILVFGPEIGPDPLSGMEFRVTTERNRKCADLKLKVSCYQINKDDASFIAILHKIFNDSNELNVLNLTLSAFVQISVFYRGL
jgi:hypothetical protein